MLFIGIRTATLTLTHFCAVILQLYLFAGSSRYVMLPNVALSSKDAENITFDTVDECALFAMTKEKKKFSFNTEDCSIAGNYINEAGAATYVKKCE